MAPTLRRPARRLPPTRPRRPGPARGSPSRVEPSTLLQRGLEGHALRDRGQGGGAGSLLSDARPRGDAPQAGFTACHLTWPRERCSATAERTRFENLDARPSQGPRARTSATLAAPRTLAARPRRWVRGPRKPLATARRGARQALPPVSRVLAADVAAAVAAGRGAAATGKDSLHGARCGQVRRRASGHGGGWASWAGRLGARPVSGSRRSLQRGRTCTSLDAPRPQREARAADGGGVGDAPTRRLT